MKIAGMYSFNYGKEAITKQHRQRLEEVLQVIDAVDAESCKTKESKEKTMMGKLIYSPPALNNKFKEQFAMRNWSTIRSLQNIQKNTMFLAIHLLRGVVKNLCHFETWIS